MSEPAPSAARATSPPPARKRPRGFETTGDMVRSVLVVMALVLAVYFLGVAPQASQRPPADVSGVVQQGSASGFTISEPQLPQGWTASNARFGPDAEEGLPTLHLGYLDPDGQYGGISITRGATPTWVQGIAGQDAVQAGERDLVGRRWDVWTNAETGGTTLVDQDAPDAASATGTETLAVTSRGDDAALETLAAAASTATALQGVGATG